MESRPRSRLDLDGFAIAPARLSATEIDRLLAAIGEEGRHGIRDLLATYPEVADLARSPAVRETAEEILGPDCFAVRGLLFDKTTTANWKVAWHQDITIAVRSRLDIDGFGLWSEKAGIAHVRPPSAILEGMVTLRIHLDACSPDNGPLRVIPGSHRLGRLDHEDIPRNRAAGHEVPILADRGEILMMRPLLIHASSAATNPGHRRVIHLEFAAGPLPGGLEWHGHW